MGRSHDLVKLPAAEITISQHLQTQSVSMFGDISPGVEQARKQRARQRRGDAFKALILQQSRGSPYISIQQLGNCAHQAGIAQDVPADTFNEWISGCNTTDEKVSINMCITHYDELLHNSPRFSKPITSSDSCVFAENSSPNIKIKTSNRVFQRKIAPPRAPQVQSDHKPHQFPLGG